MHHIMLEFDDNLNEMNYLHFFSKFSWVNIIMKLIDPKIFEGRSDNKNTLDFHLLNLKICDFDFFLGENISQGLSNNIDNSGYNEMFYIKYF